MTGVFELGLVPLESINEMGCDEPKSNALRLLKSINVGVVLHPPWTGNNQQLCLDMDEFHNVPNSRGTSEHATTW